MDCQEAIRYGVPGITQALEKQCGIRFISITEEFSDSAEGKYRLWDTINRATLYSEALSEKVTRGMEERAQKGRFIGHAPYGYENYREDLAGLIRVHPEEANVVRNVFRLFASGAHTIDSLRLYLFEQAIHYKPNQAKFNRSTLHAMLHNRAYIGEIPFKGQWLKGAHDSIIDRCTWDTVQRLLRPNKYQSHNLLFGSLTLTCKHCGLPITGECKRKTLASGHVRQYVYYRCSKYSLGGHPRVRITEGALEEQVLSLFRRMHLSHGPTRRAFLRVLRASVSLLYNRKKTIPNHLLFQWVM